MDAGEIAAIVLAIVAIGVAIWQGIVSRQQLKLAQDTEARTERALEEIRKASGETRLIAEDIKSNLLTQINRVLDTKLQGETNNQAMGAELLRGMLSGMGQKSDGPAN